MSKRIVILVGVIGLLASCGIGLAQDCVWRPWAAPWSNLNEGVDLFPPNEIYDPTNWDYSFSQTTLLNTTQDTPDASSYALHWFLDGQPPDGSSDKQGSGGVYQEITVNTTEPLRYSFWWKGAQDDSFSWYEFIIIDGPFDVGAADGGPVVGKILRKREDTTFGWQQLTDASGLHVGPDGPTFTPTSETVTVVLKMGRSGGGATEAFFDDVQVWQDSHPDNYLVNGDFEDVSQQTPCDDELMFQDPNTNPANYWLGLTDCPADQHTLASVAPGSASNDATETVLTLNGNFLENVSEVQLVPVSGGDAIVSTSLETAAGPDMTSRTATLPTLNEPDGIYDVVSIQAPSPPCLTEILPAAFELTCPNGWTFTEVVDPVLTDPTGFQSINVSGTNLGELDDIELQYIGNSPPTVILDGSISGVDQQGVLEASFSFDCAPSGQYRLKGVRNDPFCNGPTLDYAFSIAKTPPAPACAWQPWASDWANLNLGEDLADPPEGVFDPTNWDYSFGQATELGTVQDTPDGSDFALHWFLDGQPPSGVSDGEGSGGVFQEIAVQEGVPIQYSFYWKGASDSGDSWFEFMLLDGPFGVGTADRFEEGALGNNPAAVRRRTLSGAGSFGWEQLTDQSPAHSGPTGPRPTSITPSGSIVTVVLKAGRSSPGAMESFWDAIDVNQGGANLLTNGDFESLVEQSLCNSEPMLQEDQCELEYWRKADFQVITCGQPFADADGDNDVDQEDFAMFQACFTGPNGGVPPGCECFDRPGPGLGDGGIDSADLLEFEECASGPAVFLDPEDPASWPAGCD